VVFASVNGVREAFRRLHYLGLDARAFGGTRICAIGSATAEALKEQGILADLKPKKYVSEAMVRELRDQWIEGNSILLLRADAGRDVLSKGMSNAGAQVDDVVVYQTVVPEESREKVQELVSEGKIDVITFTSSSTVTNLLALLDGDATFLRGAIVACIGPITADAARDVGLTVDVVAQESTIPGLVDALVGFLSAVGGD
jgi:uroporphyrinogen III methyltransferase/synthase